MHLGLDTFRAIGGHTLISYFSGLLAEAYAAAGQVEEGLTILARLDREMAPWWKAELYRLNGELILKASGQPITKAGRETFRLFYLEGIERTREAR